MRSPVYKTPQGEALMYDLYDMQVSALHIDYEDLYVETRFGKTHLIKTGNPEGKPLLLFHGGNSTTPYYLRDFLFLRREYLIFAVDTMGHPGKSAQTVLSAKDLQYGEWASDVIDGLGFDKLMCIGGSFGGGILAKLMCVAPHKIDRAILFVPSGICNASTAKILTKLGIPMLMYTLTKSDKWLEKAILPMALEESEIDESTLVMVKHTFEHVRVKAGMPSNVNKSLMESYKAPTLLIAGEKDVLFPGEQVISRAKLLFSDLRTYLMVGSGHMTILSAEKHKAVLQMISAFLEE